MNKIILNIIAALSLCALMACSEDMPESVTETAGDNAITISFFSETDVTATRSDFYGSASHINQLIYMIYKKDGEEYIKDEYYLKKDSYQAQMYENGMPLDNQFKKLEYCGEINDKSSPYTIRLVPNPADDPDQMYKVVCWAQKKDSHYFDLTQFPDKISMNYGAIPNNEEEADAFYGVTEFKASASSVTVNLKRPFAQINIGTPGWDYEGFATIQPTAKIIKYSMIRIGKVAKSFSPLNKKAEKTINVENDNITELIYSWAIIPAYRNLQLLKREYLDSITGVWEDDKKSGIFTDAIKEEFLEIYLRDTEKPDEKGEEIEGANGNFKDHGGYDKEFKPYPYISWKTYDKLCAENVGKELADSIFTETFKYLSMCYILVPFEEDEEGNLKGSTVDVTFDCSVGPKVPEETEEEDPGVSTTPMPAVREYEGVLVDKKVFEITNVPVKCNNRTNIVATDGSGFFMNTNELRVSVFTETFADYYKHHHAIDEYWDREEEKDYDSNNPGYHGESDERFDDDYQWPDGSVEDQPSDFDPDLGKIHINLSDFCDINNSLVNAKNKTVDAIKFFDDDVNFSIDLLAGRNVYTDLDDMTVDDFTFEYYLDGEKIDEDYISPNGSKITVNIPSRDINDWIARNPESFVIEELHEYEENRYVNNGLVRDYVDVPALKYYPLEFKVKTKAKESHKKYAFKDLVVTIRIFTSYKFTFSENSEDEGSQLWNAFSVSKTMGSGNDDNYEKNSYFIENLRIVSSDVGHISAKARSGTGSNNRVFALKDNDHGDHIRFRGAFNNTNGHWVTINKLKENCKITVKLGRDAGMDNSSSGSATGFNRGLHVNWGQCEIKDSNTSDQDEKSVWEGIDVIVANIGIKLNGTVSNNQITSKTTYLNTETKIMNGGNTSISQSDLTNGKDVTLYVDESGHCYYWIILSEPD